MSEKRMEVIKRWTGFRMKACFFLFGKKDCFVCKTFRKAWICALCCLRDNVLCITKRNGELETVVFVICKN